MWDSNKELNLRKITGYEPLDWTKEVRESEARFKVLAIGRRGGKSYYVAKDTKNGLAADLVQKGQKIWIVAPNYDLTQRIWDEVMIMVQKDPYKQIIKRVNNTKGWYRLETHFGTTIEAKSADEPEKLVGTGLTKLLFDEVALAKKKAWTQSLRPTLIDFKGKALFISTPKGKNWFYDLYLKGQNPEEKDWASWRFPSFVNSYLSESELKEMSKDMSEAEYRQEILAEFEESAEQVFRKIRQCVEGELKEPEESLYQIGIDLGRKTDYSVICVINEKTNHLDYFDRFKIIDWSLQKARIKEIADRYPHRCLRVDATAMGGDVFCEQLRDEGLAIDPYIYTETTKKQLIEKLSVFIENRKVTFPLIPQLLFELERFGRERMQSGNVRYKGMGSSQDDCVNALGLAVWGLYSEPLDYSKIEPIKALKTTFK